MWSADAVNAVCGYLAPADLARFAMALGPGYARQLPLKGRYVPALIGLYPAGPMEDCHEYFRDCVERVAEANRERHEVVMAWAVSAAEGTLSAVSRRPAYDSPSVPVDASLDDMWAQHHVALLAALRAKARSYRPVRFTDAPALPRTAPCAQALVLAPRSARRRPLAAPSSREPVSGSDADGATRVPRAAPQM